MEKDQLAKLLLTAKERQRKTTDLSEFDSQLKEMMAMNISLPIILEWLENEQQKKTTLPALRRYVKRIFGDLFYEEFVSRNGWKKHKRLPVTEVLQQSSTGASSQPASPKRASPVSSTKKVIPKASPSSDKKSDIDALKAVIHGNLDTSKYD